MLMHIFAGKLYTHLNHGNTECFLHKFQHKISISIALIHGLMIFFISSNIILCIFQFFLNCSISLLFLTIIFYILLIICTVSYS